MLLVRIVSFKELSVEMKDPLSLEYTFGLSPLLEVRTFNGILLKSISLEGTVGDV